MNTKVGTWAEAVLLGLLGGPASQADMLTAAGLPDGSLHRTFRKLVAEGLLEEAGKGGREGSRGGRRRKLYKLTHEGEREAHRLRSSYFPETR